MAQLIYSNNEIMGEHSYARPHVEAGYKLHGGFDSEGTYISPRTVHRWDAIKAWNGVLSERGWPLIDASQKLLARGNYPSAEQTAILLDAGIGEPLWNALTVTGVIEARGRALCDFDPPRFDEIIDADLTTTAIGHLHKGLLFAHGLDEGGDPASDIGAHDAMWFAVRDMLFGKDAYPLPEIPDSIARPEAATREMPQMSEGHEGLVKLLMNVLMIEVRAESFFSYCEVVMRSPSNFKDRRAEAELAADIVGRIRIDEAVHVAYLQTVISEFRSFDFKTPSGLVAGRSIIDPVWAKMVDWHTKTNWENSREQSRSSIRELINACTDGDRLWTAFEGLDEIAA